MDEAWKQARLDELWDAYVLAVPGVFQEDDLRDRASKAIDSLRALRILYERASADGQVEQTGEIARQGRVVWQLLSLEFGDWLFDIAGSEYSLSERQQWINNERIALQTALKIFGRSAPDAHRQAIDPFPIIMPKWIVDSIGDALDALDQGEVQSVVAPSKFGRHDDAWTWDQMRATALEYVAFMRGQGVTAQMARRRVANSTSITESALRDWERTTNLKIGCEVAYEAGQLEVLFERAPNYLGPIDTAVIARLDRFKNLSLMDFGRLYRERFGHRHNRDPSAGN